MDFNEIKELITLVNQSKLADFKLKDKDFEIHIRTKKYFKRSGQQFVQAPQLVSNPALTPTAAQLSQLTSASEVDSDGQPSDGAAAPSTGKKTLEIKSPIVGTFYRSPGPDKPVFVKVGDTVVKGDVVCIIEAMKLFNEIESEVSGTIVKVLVEDASPVEYDQVLFLLEV